MFMSTANRIRRLGAPSCCSSSGGSRARPLSWVRRARRGTAVAGLESIQQSAGTTSDKAKASIDSTKGINQASPTASLTVNPTTLAHGQSAMLTWQTTNATSVSIDQGIGTVQPNSSLQVTPTASTTYTLTAKGAGGAQTAAVTLTVQ